MQPTYKYNRVSACISISKPTYPINFLYVFYVQNPFSFLFVRNQENPIVCGDYIGVYAENCFAFLLKPSNLFIFCPSNDNQNSRVVCNVIGVDSLVSLDKVRGRRSESNGLIMEQKELVIRKDLLFYERILCSHEFFFVFGSLRIIQPLDWVNLCV